MASLMRYKNTWYIKYKDLDGRWKRKSCGENANKTEAKALMRKFADREFNERHNAPIKIVPLSPVEAVTFFRDKVISKEHKAKSSILKEHQNLSNFIEYLKSNQIKNYDRIDVQAYIDYRHSQGIAPKTLKHEMRMIKRFYMFALEKHFTVGNPTEKVVLPKIIAKRPRFFSVEELNVIYSASQEPFSTCFRFLANTGLRAQELSNLRWQDWNEELNQLTVRVCEGNKSKHEDTIPLNTVATEILLRQKEKRNGGMYIFSNSAGNKIHNRNLYRALQRVITNEKLPAGRVHDLRHSFASHLVIQGVSLYVVKELLRHQNINETQIYSHLTQEAKEKAVNTIAL